MSFGKPSIATPARADVRELQSIIGNIRERFAAIESALTQAQKTLASSTDVQSIASLQAQLLALQSAVNALTIGPSASGQTPRQIMRYVALRMF